MLVGMPDVTHILSALEAGDPKAAAELLPLVYDELRKLAAARMAEELARAKTKAEYAKAAQPSTSKAAAAAVAAGEDPEAAEAAAAASVTGKKGKNKGKGKRDTARRGSDATEESVSKKRKTIG